MRTGRTVRHWPKSCISRPSSLTSGPNEGVIKSIAELKKRADEVYETARHFDLSVITPIRLAAMQCQQLIATKLAEAERLDNDMPLVWGGLRQAVMDHVNGLAHYTWSDEDWVVRRRSDVRRRAGPGVTPGNCPDFAMPACYDFRFGSW